jgi:hypothetical protein
MEPVLSQVLLQSVGYTSESTFSNVFKRAKGVGPKRYKDTMGSNANSPNSVEFSPHSLHFLMILKGELVT